PVVRVNVLEIFRVRPGLSPGLESKNSPAFIRPSHLIGFEIEHPAADMRDALCLYELIVTLAQRLIRYCPFDRSGNEHGCCFQEVDLDILPNPLLATIVEAK